MVSEMAKQTRLKNQKASSGNNKKLPGRAVTPQEIQSLLRACGKGAAGYRNAAFIALCAGAGLRCAEALAVMPSHIEKTNCGTIVTVIRGKGGKSRKVAFVPEFEGFVDRWVERRRLLGIGGRSPLVCGITKSTKGNSLGGSRGTFGKPISSALMRGTIVRLAKKARIEGRVHVHGLRHGMATMWAKAGVELRAISQQLGHASPSTTDRYLAKINPAALLLAASTVKMLSLNI
jgi:integrase